MQHKILCIGTTPAVQRVMVFRQLALDAVNRASTTVDGGAGKSFNVAKVLQVLGERPLAVGFFGGDRGEFLKRLLASKGIESEFITVASRTRECITVIDQATGKITELVEESPPVTAAEYDQLTGVIRSQIQDARAVILSGTLAPGGRPDFYYHCAMMARAADILTVVDAQGPALLEALKARPGLVKPNRPELAATTGRVLTDEAAVRGAMEQLHERGAQRVVVTAGKDPALAFDGCRFWRIHSPAVRAVNPIGSGDAFTAGLVWRLLGGDELGEACRWAAAAGAANALTLLAGEVDRSEVERLAPQAQVESL